MSFALSYHNKQNLTLVETYSPLLTRLKSGNKTAQREYYTAEFDRLVRIPLRYVNSKNEAITIVNDSFIKIFKSIINLEEVEKLPSWSAAITRNTTLDYVRKRVKYDRRHVDVEDHQEVSVTLNTAMESLTMDEILKHIQSLDERERVVFSMYAIDGYKHAEIGKSMGISEGTSKWYLNKARKNLQLILKSYM